MYVLVVFTYNTVRTYEIVNSDQLLARFMDECKYVHERADLDIRDAFISYSDDNRMVQLIGPITSTIAMMVQNAIDDMRSTL